MICSHIFFGFKQCFIKFAETVTQPTSSVSRWKDVAAMWLCLWVDGCQENSKAICERPDPVFHSARSSTLNRSGFNVRPDTLKQLDENTRNHAKISQKRALVAQNIVAKIEKQDCIRFKETKPSEQKRTKRQSRQWEGSIHRGLVCCIYRELKK